MKILLAASEVHPYSKTGGLADMVGALAKALARAGHQTAVVTPLYGRLRDSFPTIRMLEGNLDLTLGTRPVQGRIGVLQLGERLTVYFIDQPEFYQRASLY